MEIAEKIAREQQKMGIPDFRPGDTVRVHVRIPEEKSKKEGEKGKKGKSKEKEEERFRTQVFEGVVIRFKRGKLNSTITVRKVSYGVGVERIFPLHSPSVDKIEIVSKGKVRRSRLYYLRKLRGKAAKIREKQAS